MPDQCRDAHLIQGIVHASCLVGRCRGDVLTRGIEHDVQYLIIVSSQCCNAFASKETSTITFRDHRTYRNGHGAYPIEYPIVYTFCPCCP